MNRALRRLAHGPKLCKPGTHRFQAWTAGGDIERIVCIRCSRTFMQVMEESPADLAIYRRWLATELGKAVHAHPPNPLKPLVKGCPGCDRERELLEAAPSKLAVAKMPVDDA
jgi:hypothetical protein